MELDLLSSLLLLLLTILLILKFSKPSKRSNEKLPPGPWKLPLIGNLPQLVGGRTRLLPHQRLAELARVYGPIMNLRLGEVPTFIISSAEAAREVMRTHDAVLCNRPKLLLAEHIYYGSTNIGLAPYGDYWRHVRRIATLELFTAKRVSLFRPVREEEVARLIKSIAMEEGSVVNLGKMIFVLAFDITSRVTFGKRGNEHDEYKRLMEDITSAASGFSICDLYPSIEFLQLITGTRRKFQDLVKRTDKIFDPIISEHIAKKRVRNKEDDQEDLVDALLKFHKDSSFHATDEFSLTTENIKSIILEVSTGSDTSSATVEWAMCELLKNPTAMEKAQDEIRQALKSQGKEMIDETSLDEFIYMKQVIKETLRLHPPLPLLGPRESIERCQINGYEIPSKTRVLINAWAIGRDPKYWTDPQRFYPERFEGSSIDFKGNHFELIPFGAGRRACPGMKLGLANVELALASLLYHFDWMLPDEIKPQDLNMEETFGITTRRKHDLLAIPTLHPCSPYKLSSDRDHYFGHE